MKSCFCFLKTDQTDRGLILEAVVFKGGRAESSGSGTVLT